MMRLPQPEGHNMSLFGSGHPSGGLILEGRPEPSCCGLLGHGETGFFSVPVIAPQEGCSLRGRRRPLAADRPARGRRVVSPSWEGWLVSEGQCPFAVVHQPSGDGSSLHASGGWSGWLVTKGQPKPPCYGFYRHEETGCLSVPVVFLGKEGSLRGGHCPPAEGSRARRRRDISPSRWSLLGRGGH